ncbi:hypothetical protein COCCADRAFT_37255 [Bipolaris zeicola 26-R-13]|uniref:Uncharacterized protein n=1 Tax=Cochliobolus carbonum (strain 26-R-13) TaxID=930089 RepID=W6YN93_COCC2|nr:uncharacterized protein COCCADRAFT_37255 [Bipolaris zeicola 26-R-13]EUC32906.1 hypothetical protein COCCADRAFT_37255 [Bipolaris zeicola 26-R-13]
MARKKSKAQKTFERERAEVSHIILDRGETLPGSIISAQIMFQNIANVLLLNKEETEENSYANPRAFTDDDDWMVDDDDNDDAINAIQSTFEETNTSQDTEETEMQQSSVDNSAKKKRYYPRLLGFKRKGNARKNAAKLQAMNALPGHESEIFEETGVHLKDEDQILGEEEKKATVENMPPKYRMDSDPRLGELEVDTTSHIQEGERHDRFVETARKIVSFLKSSASTYRNLPREAKKTTWKPMVSGLLTLMCRASEDFLLENLLSGIDNSVRFTLGNLDFTLDDLVNLPRWSVTKNLEKGVYVDILHIKEELEQIRQLYVGSATGKFGIAQRWYQYLQRRVKHEYGRHSKAILKPNLTVCLRGLAQYDDTRYPWLVCFAETFFMVYLGTVTDPGWRPTTGDIREAFINDELYELVGACRRAAGLPAPLSVGLNSTWSLCQGYRGGLNINSACFNCERKKVWGQSQPVC